MLLIKLMILLSDYRSINSWWKNITVIGSSGSKLDDIVEMLSVAFSTLQQYIWVVMTLALLLDKLLVTMEVNVANVGAPVCSALEWHTRYFDTSFCW